MEKHYKVLQWDYCSYYYADLEEAEQAAIEKSKNGGGIYTKLYYFGKRLGCYFQGKKIF